MNFRDDTKPPLSTERSDLYWGTHLTYSERLAEDLDLPPHRAALESAQSDGATGRRAGGLSHDGGRPAESTRAPAFGDPRLPQRFWEKVTPDADGCWIWYQPRGGGYGQFWKDGAHRAAHRVAYEALVGPIPDGLQSDHLCRVRLCVNPAHLEPVTARENNRRSSCCSTGLAERQHCKHGHPYTPENTRMRGTTRICLECQRRYERERAARVNARGLHQPSSRLSLLLGATADGAPDVAGTHGVDTDVAPTSSAPGGKP